MPKLHTYRDGSVALTAGVYRPAGAPKAAVAVFPTIMNPTPAVEAKAQALADAGYLAVIGDFYGEAPPNFEASIGLAEQLRSNPDRYRARLHALLEVVDHLAPSAPKAAIGFCIGGQAVLELARDGADFLVGVSFHGLLDTQRPAQPGAVKARLLVCHGDADALVPRAQVLAFWEEMDRAKADWHFHSYSGVGHGFTNPHPPAAGGKPAFDASADRQSWAAMLSLFDEVFD